MSTVVVIRPGATEFDEQRRIQGSLDLPLSSRGQAQVQEIIEQLREVPLEMIYASPSEPACGTAHALGDGLGVRIKELDGLRNVCQGLWEGLPLDEIRRKYPKVFKQWEDAPESICPPQGETVSEALDRIHEALQKPLKRQEVFAIVASEPLASLIRHAVYGTKPECLGPVCGCPEGQQVEFLRTNGDSNAWVPPNGGNRLTTETLFALRPPGETADEFGPEA